MEGSERYEELIFRFFTDNLTDSEKQELEKWQRENPENRQQLEKIRRELKITEEGKLFYHLEEEVVWQKLRVRMVRKRLSGRKSWVYRGLRYVAIIVLPLLVGGIGWLLFRQKTVEPWQIAKVENIVPGSGRAILVLNNGEQKILDGQQQKVLEIAGGVKVKHEQQLLSYDSLVPVNPQEIVYKYGRRISIDSFRWNESLVECRKSVALSGCFRDWGTQGFSFRRGLF